MIVQPEHPVGFFKKSSANFFFRIRILEVDISAAVFTEEAGESLGSFVAFEGAFDFEFCAGGQTGVGDA